MKQFRDRTKTAFVKVLVVSNRTPTSAQNAPNKMKNRSRTGAVLKIQIASRQPCRAITLFPLSFCAFLFQRSLGCRQSRDRHAEWRAADISQTRTMTELDRVGIATVFAANTQLDFRSFAAAFLDSDLHQLTDTRLIN